MTPFKIKIHFATLFKTKDLTLWLWFVSFCNNCKPIIINLYTLIKASGPKRPPRRLTVKLYILLVPGTCNDRRVRDETWTILHLLAWDQALHWGKGEKTEWNTKKKSVSEASQAVDFGRAPWKLPSPANFFGPCRFFFRLFPPLVPGYTAPSQGNLRNSNLSISAWTMASTLSPETCYPRSNIMFPRNSMRVTGTNWYFWRFHSLYYFLPCFFTTLVQLLAMIFLHSSDYTKDIVNIMDIWTICWDFCMCCGSILPWFNLYFSLSHTHYHYITIPKNKGK